MARDSVDVETAIETQIAPQLQDDFGREVGTALLTRATLCFVTMEAEESERYEAFVHAICSDEQVLSVWGAEAAAQREELWKALIKAGP
jgi:hypothetical protein